MWVAERDHDGCECLADSGWSARIYCLKYPEAGTMSQAYYDTSAVFGDLLRMG